MDLQQSSRIIDLEKKLSDCEILCKHKTKEIEELETKLTKFCDLEADFEVLQNRNHHLEQQLLEKIQQLNFLKSKYSDLEELWTRDREIVGAKETEICDLKTKIKESEKLPAELSEAARKSELLAVEISELKDIIRKKDQKIEFLGKEVKSAESELDRTMKDTKKIIDKELDHEEKLETEVEILTKKISERHAEIEELKKKCSVIPGLEKQLHHREAEINQFQDKYRRLEEAKEHVETKIHDLNAEIHSLKEELKRKSNIIAQLEKEDKLLVAEFEESQKESSAVLEKVVHAKDAKIEQLKENYGSEICSLRTKVSELNRECEHLNIEKKKITEALDIHFAREKDLYKKVEELKKEKELLTTEIVELVAEKDRLKGKISIIDKEAFRLDKNVHHLSDENWLYTAKIDELEKKLKHESHRIAEKDTEIANLKDSLSKIEHSHSELVHERDNLKNENALNIKKLSELESSKSSEKISQIQMNEAEVVKEKVHTTEGVCDKKY